MLTSKYSKFRTVAEVKYAEQHGDFSHREAVAREAKEARQASERQLNNSLVVWVFDGVPEDGICLIRRADGSHYKLCSNEIDWWLEEIETHAIKQNS